MNSYTLDDSAMDAAFLNGETITCRAVLSAQEQRQNLLREGDPLLVVLSTGPKYKGTLKGITPISTIQGRALMELHISRH